MTNHHTFETDRGVSWETAEALLAKEVGLLPSACCLLAVGFWWGGWTLGRRQGMAAPAPALLQQPHPDAQLLQPSRSCCRHLTAVTLLLPCAPAACR